MGGDSPAHDHPAEGVGDEAHVGHSGPGRHERQIGDPQLVGGGRGEVAADQVGVTRAGRIGPAGADLLAASGAFDAGDAHQPGGLVAADVVTGANCRFPQLAGAVDPVVVLPDPDQNRDHRGVALIAGAGLPVAGRVVGARGHLHPCAAQDRADGLDPEIGAVGVDEVHYFLCWRSSSAPKKLAARFRISLARLSSRFSCSSSRILRVSAVDTPGV